MLSKLVTLVSKKHNKTNAETQAQKPSSKMRWGLKKRGKSLSADIHALQTDSGLVSENNKSNLKGSNGNLIGDYNNDIWNRSGGRTNSETSSRRQSNDTSTVVEEETSRLRIHDVDSKLDQPLLKHEDIFPSLSDSFLSENNLLTLPIQAQQNSHDLTEEQIKEKFELLAMAFKSDSETMTNRLTVHLRNRTTTEHNARKEILNIKEFSRALMSSCSDSHSRELCTKLQSHIDILEYAIVRLSGKAELCGAAQQEMRLGRAIELMFQHVEGLQAKYKREHTELQEVLKPLQGAIERQNSLLVESSQEKFSQISTQKSDRNIQSSDTVDALIQSTFQPSVLSHSQNVKENGLVKQPTAHLDKKLLPKYASTSALAQTIERVKQSSLSSSHSSLVKSASSNVKHKSNFQLQNIAKNPTGLRQRRADSITKHLNRSASSSCLWWMKLLLLVSSVVLIFLVVAIFTILILPDDDVIIVPNKMLEDIENVLTSKQTVVAHQGIPS